MYDPRRERYANELLSFGSLAALLCVMVLHWIERESDGLIPILIAGSIIFNLINLGHVIWLTQQDTQPSDHNETQGLTFLFFFNLGLLFAGVAMSCGPTVISLVKSVTE